MAKATVKFGKKPSLEPTVNWDKITPKGGWNPNVHQKPSKPVGKTKTS